MGWNQPEPVEEPEGSGGAALALGALAVVVVLALAGGLLSAAVVIGTSLGALVVACLGVRFGLGARWPVGAAVLALVIGVLGGLALADAISSGLLVGSILAGAWAWWALRRGRPWQRHRDHPPRQLYRLVHRTHRGEVPHSLRGLRPDALGRPAPALRSPTPRQGRIALGTEPGRPHDWILARIHAAVIAGTGSGKTRGIVIPMILRWLGPILVTSTKGDVVDDLNWGAGTWHWRRSLGECWVFELTGEMARRGYPSIVWSPLWRVRDWSGAVKLANILADAAGRGGAEDGKSSFFTSRAIESIAAYLWAAVLAGKDMGQVLRWLQTGQRKETKAELEEILKGDIHALASLSAGGSDASVADAIATCRTFLTPWQDPGICAQTALSEWTPDDLLLGMNSLYVLSFETNSSRLQNVYTLLVADVLERAKELAGGPKDDRPDLLGAFLDEAANVSPLGTLPQTLSTCREYARILSVWQDLGQIERIYGPQGARSILANSGEQIWWPPADGETAEYLGKVLGSQDRRQATLTPGPMGGRPGKSHQTVAGTRASVDELMSAVWPIVIGASPCEVEPRNYDSDPVLSARSRGLDDPDDTDDDTPDPPRPERDDEVVDYSLPEGLFDGAGQGMSA
jgi:hypothetical protein